MSGSLWDQLPAGFIKRSKHSGWKRLSPEERLLVVRLAQEQHYRCALCPRTKDMVIEHDHDPEVGRGDKPNLYNIRGLTCQRCNWHLRKYEAEQCLEYFGWDHASSYVSDREYENYIYAYECRVAPLVEAVREARMGSRNYAHRHRVLFKFDDWRDYGGRRRTYPWRSYFAEIKERRQFQITSPQKFLRMFKAITAFVIAESDRNPDYRPPDAFIVMAFKLKEMIETARGSQGLAVVRQ